MTLNVYFEKTKCGILSSTDNRGIIFCYTDEYLQNPFAKAISISLPLQKEEFSQKQCLPFFSGLLPEEYTRKKVADYLHISELSTIKLLEAIGKECAGVITITNQTEDVDLLKTEYEIKSSNYQKLSKEDLEKYVQDIPIKPFIKADDKLRLSLAGAQEKLSLAYFDNSWYLPLNGAPSTHILKPTREGSFSSLAKNEFNCMQLAKKCGLNVAQVKLEKIANKDVLIITRYDRIIKNSKITRLHQEDMCQALGIMSEKKYQADGGPSIKTIYELIKEKLVLPIIDLQYFLQYVIFNYLIGNCDAHAKNYSFLYDKNGNARLAPLYDVVSTKEFKTLSNKLSMKIGKHYELEKICYEDFIKLANEIDINPKVIFKIIEELKEKIVYHSRENHQETFF